jgi:hypothetical protein
VINLRLLARPTVAWELTANFARTSTYFAMLFVLAQYLQQGLGRSATYCGPGPLARTVIMGSFGRYAVATAHDHETALAGGAR